MPSLSFSSAMTANGTYTPLSGWQYEYLPWPAAVSVISTSTDANVLQTFSSGSETIVEESPTSGGGTAGRTPSALNFPVTEWVAAAGDRLKLNFRETAGGTPTVDGIINVEPYL